MLNEQGYSHEVVTDEDGRTWLKPAVTITYVASPVEMDSALMAKHIKDSLARSLQQEEPRSRFGAWWRKRRNLGAVA